MWIMLLSGGVVPAYEASSTRMGFITLAQTSLTASTTRLGVITATTSALKSSTTRLGLIVRSKT